jgi:hypothetical protein
MVERRAILPAGLVGAGSNQRVRPGAFIEAFEELARKPTAFASSIEYVKTKR